MSVRDKILGVGRTVVPVDVPEWGETVYVHRLSLADKVAAAACEDDLGRAEVIAWFVIRAARDAAGARIFGDDDLATVANDLDGDAVRLVWNAVREVNKLFQSAAEATAEKKD